MGILDKMKELAAEGQRTLDAQKAREDEKGRALAQVIVSTGDIPQAYRVIDAAFAMDSHQGGFFSGSASPAKAFEGVKRQLREASLALGGDAIINCQFEYRVALGSNDKQCIEIFAYGTAVKMVKDSHEDLPATSGLNTKSTATGALPPQQQAETASPPQIVFPCPKCAQSLKVDGSCAGQVANCPNCSAEIQIPAK